MVPSEPLIKTEPLVETESASENTARPRPICLLIGSLAGGGAEKVLTQLANDLADTGEQVILITWDQVAHDRYLISPQVQRIGLGLMQESRSIWQALKNNRERKRKLKRVLQELSPKVLLSFQTEMNVIALMASGSLPDCRCYVSERSHPLLNPIGRPWRLLRKKYYKRATGVIVQTEGARDLLKGFVPENKLTVIPNGIKIDEEQTSTPEQQKQFISVQRLSPEKGPQLLVEAFSQIAAQLPDWRLVLLGEGGMRTQLEDLVAQNQLQHRISLPGWCDETRIELKQSSIFILPSLFEGFPNALLEAMSCGLPVISFDCDFGPRELIEPEINGRLVPVGDVDQLVQAMIQLAERPELRQQWGAAARMKADQYDWKQVFSSWKQLLID